MPESTDTASFLLKSGERRTVTRDQISKAIPKFDETKRGIVPETQGGWFVLENERRYNPKWLLRLTTGLFLGAFRGHEARETLRALGFDLRPVDPDINGGEDGEGEEPEETDGMTFRIEHDLQNALRNKIEQLELGLKVSDGDTERMVKFSDGVKEQTVESGFIDITAEDKDGATVVIELKAGEAGRHAIGQIAAYMGVLVQGKKPIRGILVAREFSPQAIAAARVVRDLQLRKYSFKFAFEIVGAS